MTRFTKMFAAFLARSRSDRLVPPLLTRPINAVEQL